MAQNLFKWDSDSSDSDGEGGGALEIEGNTFTPPKMDSVDPHSNVEGGAAAEIKGTTSTQPKMEAVDPQADAALEIEATTSTQPKMDSVDRHSDVEGGAALEIKATTSTQPQMEAVDPHSDVEADAALEIEATTSTQPKMDSVDPHSDVERGAAVEIKATTSTQPKMEATATSPPPKKVVVPKLANLCISARKTEPSKKYERRPYPPTSDNFPIASNPKNDVIKEQQPQGPPALDPGQVIPKKNEDLTENWDFPWYPPSFVRPVRHHLPSEPVASSSRQQQHTGSFRSMKTLLRAKAKANAPTEAVTGTGTVNPIDRQYSHFRKNNQPK